MVLIRLHVCEIRWIFTLSTCCINMFGCFTETICKFNIVKKYGIDGIVLRKDDSMKNTF